MKITDYLHSGPSSESRLEKLADALNFLGRYSLRTDRVDYDTKINALSRKKNAFFELDCMA